MTRLMTGLLRLVPTLSLVTLHTAAAQGPHPNFLFFRYASATSFSLYGAYGKGNALLVFGMVQNPRSTYHEIAAGLGWNVTAGDHASMVVAGTVSRASDSWYGQLYLLPSLSVGRVSVNGSLEFYQPLSSAGAHQLDVNPWSVLVRTVGGVKVGGSYLLYGQVGAAPLQEAGPAVLFPVPNGTIQAEWLRRFGKPVNDVRVTFQASF
jgi:hypothetical protein